MTPRVLALLLLALLALLPGLARAQGSDPRDADILRYLAATQQAASFKHGIRVVIAEEGRSNAMLDGVLALPDATLEAAVLPVLRQHLDAAEARALADFYSSDTGQAITRQQVAQLGVADPPIALSAAQRAELEAFKASAGGRADGRLDALSRTNGAWGPATPAIIEAATRRR